MNKCKQTKKQCIEKTKCTVRERFTCRTQTNHKQPSQANATAANPAFIRESALNREDNVLVFINSEFHWTVPNFLAFYQITNRKAGKHYKPINPKEPITMHHLWRSGAIPGKMKDGVMLLGGVSFVLHWWVSKKLLTNGLPHVRG